jgi:hypothetical protein
MQHFVLHRVRDDPERVAFRITPLPAAMVPAIVIVPVVPIMAMPVAITVVAGRQADHASRTADDTAHGRPDRPTDNAADRPSNPAPGFGAARRSTDNALRFNGNGKSENGKHGRELQPCPDHGTSP